jgi:hypothetical protein
MVLWIGFLGKLVELVLTKIVGKQVDLSLDERKRAARTFLRLYEALTELEDVAFSVAAEIERVLTGRRPYLYRNSFIGVAQRGDAASGAFLDLVSDLQHVIQIYDRPLANILETMLEVKGAMLLSAATRMRFEILSNRDGFVLHYSAPSDQLMASDLQTTYSAAQDTYGARQVDRNYQWPANVFLSIVEDNLVEGRMTDEDSVARTDEATGADPALRAAQGLSVGPIRGEDPCGRRIH